MAAVPLPPPAIPAQPPVHLGALFRVPFRSGAALPTADQFQTYMTSNPLAATGLANRADRLFAHPAHAHWGAPAPAPWTHVAGTPLTFDQFSQWAAAQAG